MVVVVALVDLAAEPLVPDGNAKFTAVVERASVLLEGAGLGAATAVCAGVGGALAAAAVGIGGSSEPSSRPAGAAGATPLWVGAPLVVEAPLAACEPGAACATGGDTGAVEAAWVPGEAAGAAEAA